MRRKTSRKSTFTKHGVLAEIQNRIVLGTVWRLKQAKEKLPKLYNAAVRHFGSLAEAMRISRKLLEKPKEPISVPKSEKSIDTTSAVSEEFAAEELWGSEPVAVKEEVASYVINEIDDDVHGYVELLTRYLRDVKSFPRLLQVEVALLARAVREEGSQEAREALILHNLRLSLWRARKFYVPQSLDYLDLVQEGNLGLMRGIENYDERLGFRFSSYVEHWISSYIRLFLDNWGKHIRVPVNRQRLYVRVLKCKVSLYMQLGREASDAEVAEALQIKNPTVVSIALWQMANLQTVSLDEPLNREEDGSSLRYEEIPSRAMLSPDQLVEARETLDQVRTQLQESFKLVQRSIHPKYYAIFVSRYGGDNGFEKRTLEEVGERFDVTRERVRQVVEKAWSHLSGPSFANEDELARTVKRLRDLEDLTEQTVKVVIPPM